MAPRKNPDGTPAKRPGMIAGEPMFVQDRNALLDEIEELAKDPRYAYLFDPTRSRKEAPRE
jgi:hypothetical protein